MPACTIRSAVRSLRGGLQAMLVRQSRHANALQCAFLYCWDCERIARVPAGQAHEPQTPAGHTPATCHRAWLHLTMARALAKAAMFLSLGLLLVGSTSAALPQLRPEVLAAKRAVAGAVNLRAHPGSHTLVRLPLPSSSERQRDIDSSTCALCRFIAGQVDGGVAAPPWHSLAGKATKRERNAARGASKVNFHPQPCRMERKSAIDSPWRTS